MSCPRFLIAACAATFVVASCSPPPPPPPQRETTPPVATEKPQPPADPRLAEMPGERYTAEQILNGETPGRKASPPASETTDDSGFAKDRLYHVPEPGVHPRILFGPEDLPRIRKQLEETSMGRTLLAVLKERIAKGIDLAGSQENDVFNAVAGGDTTKIAALYGPLNNPPPGSTSNPLFNGLVDKSFYCLVMNDRKEGAKTAGAIAALAKYLEPQIDAANQLPGGDDFWHGSRNTVASGPTLGYAYDFAEPFMTPEQAQTVRRVISKVTKGHYSLGMDLPHHWRNWNFVGMGEEFGLLSLAIEGEDGYDPRVFARTSEVAHDYVNYSLSDQGIAKEAIGYHTAGFGHLSQLMLAMANRGDNLFIDTRYKKMLQSWFIYALQPYGGAWESSGDLGTFPPDFGTLQAGKFFYPDDAKIDYVYQNHPIVRKSVPPQPTILNLITPADPIQANGAPVNYHYGADFKLPLSLFDPERGYLFARDGWDADSTTLQFVARVDTKFVSHDDADRGTFYFTAMGQTWSHASFREVETKYTNCITIDGQGEGYSATPAKWVETIDTPMATFGAADLSYCYDWRWFKSPITMPDDEFAKYPWFSSYVPVRARLASRYAKLHFERDPLPQVIDYYSGYLAGDPRMWDEDTWIMRAPANPVQRAFRTAGLVRGNRTYALIVDDIQKDDREHGYEWAMQVPMNIEVQKIVGNDVILGPPSEKRVTAGPTYSPYLNIGLPLPAPGTPQLLVRVLQVNQPEAPTGQGNPRLETIEYLRHDDSHQFGGRSTGLGKRLILPSRSVAPDYKVLLFPFKAGEPLPVTTWSDDKKHLTLEWQGQKDEYDFAVDATGRTHLTLHRGADLIFQQP